MTSAKTRATPRPPRPDRAAGRGGREPEGTCDGAMTMSVLPRGIRGVASAPLGIRAGVGAPSAVMRQATTCCLSAAIDGWQSLGARASARMTSFCTSRGRSGRNSPMGRGSSVALRCSTSIASSPVHGCVAVSIS